MKESNIELSHQFDRWSGVCHGTGGMGGAMACNIAFRAALSREIVI